jgi:hypothetical protein
LMSIALSPIQKSFLPRRVRAPSVSFTGAAAARITVNDDRHGPSGTAPQDRVAAGVHNVRRLQALRQAVMRHDAECEHTGKCSPRACRRRAAIAGRCIPRRVHGSRYRKVHGGHMTSCPRRSATAISTRAPALNSR